MTIEQEQILQMLEKIDNGLPDDVPLTFAVDNLAASMDEPEREILSQEINSLISDNLLARHTAKETENGIPFWLEFTNKGRDAVKRIKLKQK